MPASVTDGILGSTLAAFLRDGVEVRHAGARGNALRSRGRTRTSYRSPMKARLDVSFKRLAARYRIDDGRRFKLKDHDPADTSVLDSKGRAEDALARGIERLAALQDRLFANDRPSVGRRPSRRRSIGIRTIRARCSAWPSR